MHRSNYLLIIVIIFITTQNAISQTSDYLPLSGIGVGQVHENGTSILRSMGNAHTAYYSEVNSNMGNMSSLGRLQTTVLDLGVSAENVNFNTASNSHSGWNGNLDYLSIAFPLFNPINDLLNREKKSYQVGMLLGLKPFSNLKYDVRSTKIVGLDKVTNVYNGAGGLYELMFGVGGRYKESSIGFKISHISGKFNYSQTLDLENAAYRYNTISEKETKQRMVNFEVSAQHRFILKRDVPLTEDTEGNPIRSLTIGLTYSPTLNSNLKYNELLFREHIVSPTSTGRRDTLINISDSDLEGKFPGSFKFGLMYDHDNKLQILADAQYGFWSQYEDNVNDRNLKNTLKFGFGASYLPSNDNFSSYISRINYRFGAYYGQDPRIINDEQFVDYGITTGITLPFVGKRRLTFANIMLKYGERGISDLATERYFTVGIGFSATDNNWFIKPKYD